MAIVVIGFILVVFMLFGGFYTSSPGYTTQEYMEEFYKNKPECVGFSILLNEKDTWVDAPGESFCIGYLK